MAGLVKMRNKWYCRVSLWDGYRQSLKQIPLYTTSKTIAEIRRSIVNRHEKDIKEGRDVSFQWQNDEGIIKYRQMSILEASELFFKSRRTEGIAESTMKRNLHSLNLLIKVLGKTRPLESIHNKEIERFKEYSLNKFGHSKVGININLRLIKTFLRWCVRNYYKKSMPDVQMIKIPRPLPSYISEMEWSKLINSPILSNIDRKTFHFALYTGCRLSEPYRGKIEGHWLILPAEYTKAKVEREVFLTDELIGIWYEMQNNLQEWMANGYKYENYISMVSKKFLQACRSVGIKHTFHDLRHTYAVIRYLQTRDIYQVKQELGHSTVISTEKYTKISLRRLEQDFPSYIHKGSAMKKIASMYTVSMYKQDSLPT